MRVSESSVSLSGLLSRFRGRIGWTIGLVVVESVLDLLFPLFIGIAINGLLEGSHRGVVQLGGVTLATLVVGSLRRFYDTRVYAGIYEATAVSLVQREFARDSDLSVVTARTNLLAEFVQFFEHSVPALVTSLINLVGILVIVATIRLEVFLACLGLLVIAGIQYSLTGRWNFRLNAGYNDEFERQVEALSSRDKRQVGQHFHSLMRWSIRLSDLETFNFFVVFLGVVALLVYTPIAVVDGDQSEYGFVFSALMYVLQYVGGLMGLPLIVQQVIRLQEITARLKAPVELETSESEGG